MFKGNNGTASASADANSPDRLNRIVSGTVIEGDIQCDSNIRVDGTIRGTISTKGRLVVGPTGSIEGDVTCHNAEIEGQLSGKVNVGELLSLKSTALINGNVSTGKLQVEPGAVINASVDMGGKIKDLNDIQHAPKSKENFKPAGEKAEAFTA